MLWLRRVRGSFDGPRDVVWCELSPREWSPAGMRRKRASPTPPAGLRAPAPFCPRFPSPFCLPDASVSPRRPVPQLPRSTVSAGSFQQPVPQPPRSQSVHQPVFEFVTLSPLSDCRVPSRPPPGGGRDMVREGGKTLSLACLRPADAPTRHLTSRHRRRPARSRTPAADAPTRLPTSRTRRRPLLAAGRRRPTRPPTSRRVSRRPSSFPPGG